MAVVTGTPWDLALDQQQYSAPMAAGTISARDAYQRALYARAVLVDLRTEELRRSQGALLPVLASVVVEPRALITWLVQRAAGQVVLISDDGEQAGAAAHGLAEVALARVHYVPGGFEAWRAAGLPLG